jgi:hypothetical protein
MNGEVIENILNSFGDEKTIPEGILGLEIGREFGLLGRNDAGFLANHFVDISDSQFELLTCDELEMILASNQLELLSEDLLLSTLISLCSNGLTPLDFMQLVRHVKREVLSAESMTELVSRISIDGIDSLFWSSLSCRLCRAVHKETAESRNKRFRSQEIAFGDDPLKGILSSLTAECGGNVHEKEILRITSSCDQHMRC